MAEWETYTVHIEGTFPYMAYRMTEEAEEALPGGAGKKTRTTHTKTTDPREVAESHCYRDKDDFLVHPSSAIPALLKEVGRNHKQKSSRRSLTYLVPAAVRMQDDTVALFNGNGSRAKEFEVDSRTGVNKNTKGRVLIHRPRLNTWSAEFFVRINKDIMDPDMILQLLNEGGELVGMGSFRPQCGGPFGTFQVTLFESTGSSKVAKRKRAKSTESPRK